MSEPGAELSTEVVHDRLRAEILRGELDPREPISQVQLAKRLGVSRTPLREALRMLQREGLIDSEPNRRVRVAALSVSDLEQLYAARIVVDSLRVRLVVPRLTPDDIAEMRQRLQAMGAERELDAWDVHHRIFHDLLKHRVGERLDRIAQDLFDHTERYRRVYLAEPRAWLAAEREHNRDLRGLPAAATRSPPATMSPATWARPRRPSSRWPSRSATRPRSARPCASSPARVLDGEQSRHQPLVGFQALRVARARRRVRLVAPSRGRRARTASSMEANTPVPIPASMAAPRAPASASAVTSTGTPVRSALSCIHQRERPPPLVRQAPTVRRRARAPAGDLEVAGDAFEHRLDHVERRARQGRSRPAPPGLRGRPGRLAPARWGMATTGDGRARRRRAAGRGRAAARP